MAMKISLNGIEPTVRFAAEELARYLRKATRASGRCAASSRSGTVRFTLGVCSALGMEPPKSVAPGDDWVCIRPQEDGYILSGSNPRSVLFAVYRYLQALGFRWIRPGERGEIIPRLATPLARRLSVSEHASYSYRTVCIEGAASKQHVIDLIDWMAKQGMNGYFIQFEYGSTFFLNWYRHEINPTLKPEPCNTARIRSIVGHVIAELKKRGLSFERMGHGWTCAPLGVEGEGWGKSDVRLTPARQRWLAEVNGKREFWGGVPLNTNLCYSNPAVRRAMSDRIAHYAATHPEVDVVHVWLADGSNNNCECANCRKARPTDFYVRLLNEIDAKLADRKLNAKIVFLIYVDLLWPPVKERLRNPGRFILMFAPITRTYLQSFVDALKKPAKVTPFKRNKLEMPKSAADNLAYLRAWQKQFKGGGFDFDYHALWTNYADPNHITISKTLHKDIQSLGAIGLDGYNSCQTQRVFFPHSLLMDVMARTLWDKRVSFNALARRSFLDAYGQDGLEAFAFFRAMSRLWKPFYEPVYTPAPDRPRIRQGLINLRRMKPIMAAFRRVVLWKRSGLPEAVEWSWRYLGAHLDLLDLLLPAFEAYLKGSDKTRQEFERAFDYLRKHEKTLHPVLDVNLMIAVLSWRIAEVENHTKKN